MSIDSQTLINKYITFNKPVPYKDLYIYLCVFDLSLLVASIIISLFATNYVGLVCLLLSIVLVIIKLIKVYIDLKNYKKEV